MHSHRFGLCLVGTAVLCLAAPVLQPTLNAQVTTATLQGLVLDPSGAVIPGTTVTVSNEATGQELSGTSSEGGEFAIPFIPPGTYSVVLTAEGFKATTVQGLQLATGQRANVNYTLEIGATTETVTVTGAAPLMNTVNAEQDISLNETQVDELPMINRDITGILSLGTGAAMTDGGWTMSINGLAPRGFTMTVDAVDAVPDAEFAGLALYQNFNFIKGISLEAVREVETSKNIFSAETGNTIAGNVNLISKSGTNEFHGSVFEMYQSGGLHARNHIVGVKSPLVYHQYGVSLGGPIARNKTFFFGVFEGYRFNRLTPLSGDVWSAGMRQRIASAVPAAQPYLDLWPAPTEADPPDLDPSHETCGNLGPNVPCLSPIAFFAGVGTENRKDDHAVVKVDHNVNAQNFLTFRYVRGRPLRQIPRLQIGNWRSWDGINENGAFTWTRIVSPSLTSELRWGTNVNAINRLDGAYAANEIPFLRRLRRPGRQWRRSLRQGRPHLHFGAEFRQDHGAPRDQVRRDVPLHERHPHQRGVSHLHLRDAGGLAVGADHQRAVRVPAGEVHVAEVVHRRLCPGRHPLTAQLHAQSRPAVGLCVCPPIQPERGHRREHLQPGRPLRSSGRHAPYGCRQATPLPASAPVLGRHLQHVLAPCGLRLDRRRQRQDRGARRSGDLLHAAQHLRGPHRCDHERPRRAVAPQCRGRGGAAPGPQLRRPQRGWTAGCHRCGDDRGQCRRSAVGRSLQRPSSRSACRGR